MSTVAVSFNSQLPWSPAPQYLAPLEIENDRYPEIEAKFSLTQYLVRESMLAAKTYGSAFIPRGFPHRIDSPAVWESGTLSLSEITYCASANDIKELEIAMNGFNESNTNFNIISPDTFQLPTFGPTLRDLSWKVHEGKGVLIIKGLQPDKYCLKDNIVIFAGLSSYIGDQRGRQSAQNDVLTHLYSVQDMSIIDPRPGLSNHSLPFHNDHCDILALYVMETARCGGTTRWSSFGQIYNEMIRTKPRVIEVLARNDWPHETPSKATKNLPLMFLDNHGLPFLSFTRFALTGLPTYPRDPHARKLEPEQADALDTIQFLATENAVEVAQEKGDLFFVNNRAVLHSRDKIQDSLGDLQRHLMRLCLRDTEYGRAIPEDLKRRWGDIFDNGQHKAGKWMLSKENDPSFVSNSKFDSAFTNDETTGSHG